MKKFFFLPIIILFLASCARVGSPVGGDKDTIPPKFLSSNMDTTRINVSRDIRQLRLDFDEYVTLKEINKNLIISPPIKKITRIIPGNLANKYVLIQWEDTLKANTTYNFNFGSSIADHNESNVLPYYNFAFSTGEKIDDLYVSGTVKNIFASKSGSGENSKNLVVGLYQVKDTMDYKVKPYYIAKVDEDGYYELNYLSPGKYRILAFEDENANSVFENGKENVGFLKEELTIDKNISGQELQVLPTKKTLKYKESKQISGGIQLLFEGKPEKVALTTTSEKLLEYKVSHQKKSDTVFVWFDAKKQNIAAAESENLKFSYDADGKKGEASIFYKQNAKEEMTISNQKTNILPPNYPLEISGNEPITEVNTDNWTLKEDTILVNKKISVKISEKNPFKIYVTSDFKPGKKYQLLVPKETIKSYYTSNSKPYRFDFEGDKIENYGIFTMKLVNAPKAKFWLQLLNDRQDVVYQKYTSEAETKFTELKPGDYTIRILVDNNENEYWDETDFEKGIFAEDAFVYSKPLNVKSLWEVVETWDLADKMQQATDLPKKNVPVKPKTTELEDFKLPKK